jgi:hypothetical protein
MICYRPFAVQNLAFESPQLIEALSRISGATVMHTHLWRAKDPLQDFANRFGIENRRIPGTGNAPAYICLARESKRRTKTRSGIGQTQSFRVAECPPRSRARQPTIGLLPVGRDALPV